MPGRTDPLYIYIPATTSVGPGSISLTSGLLGHTALIYVFVALLTPGGRDRSLFPQDLSTDTAVAPFCLALRCLRRHHRGICHFLMARRRDPLCIAGSTGAGISPEPRLLTGSFFSHAALIYVFMAFLPSCGWDRLLCP